jgi:hypothetical protein
MSTGQLRRRLYHSPISRVRSCIRGDARRLGDVGNSGEKMSEERERSNSARKLISLEGIAVSLASVADDAAAQEHGSG